MRPYRGSRSDHRHFLIRDDQGEIIDYGVCTETCPTWVIERALPPGATAEWVRAR